MLGPGRLSPVALPRGGAALLLAATLGACGDDGGEVAGQETVSCSYRPAGPAAKPVEQPSGRAVREGRVDLTIATSIGDLEATLDRSATPCAVHSFVSLAEQGYFDGTACHRLTLPGSGIAVLQCGDPTGTGGGGPGYSFADELSGAETYPAGTLAMANAGPDTNGSQFFVVYGDTPLPPQYVVFGTLTPRSVDLVAQVAEAGTVTGEVDGPPATPVEIDSVEIDSVEVSAGS